MVVLERNPENIARAWDQLADRVGALPFMRPGWILPWARAFAPGRLAVLSARQGAEVVGVLPFIKRPFALSSPTNWHTPAFGYLAVSSAVSHLLAQRFLALARVCADLSFLDAADPNLNVFQAVAAQAGRRVIVRTIELSPYVEIGATTWEQYRTSLSRKLIKDLERRERRLAEVGELTLDVLDGQTDFDQVLAEGLRIEGSGWKDERGTAIRSAPVTKQFYTEVGRWAAERGCLELAFLRLDGKAIAFDLCVRTDRAIHVLKGGFDSTYRRFGPGGLLTYRSLRRAFEQGVATYELLGADDPYKRIWTSSVRERVRFQAFANSPAGTISYVGWSWGRKAALGLARGSRNVELEAASGRSTTRPVRNESGEA